MKTAKLSIVDVKGNEIGEFEVSDIDDGTSETALKAHYSKHIRLFMRHIPGAYVGAVTWK